MIIINDENSLSQSVSTMNSDVFLHSYTHVDQELLYGC